MNLPVLSVSHILAIVLKTIEDYGRKMDEKVAHATIDLSEETKEEEKESEEDTSKKNKQNLSSDEVHGDRTIELDKKPKKDDTATSSKQKPTDKGTTIPWKAPKLSSFSKCESLLCFLWTAAWQLQFPNSTEDIINGPKRSTLPGILTA